MFAGIERRMMEECDRSDRKTEEAELRTIAAISTDLRNFNTEIRTEIQTTLEVNSKAPKQDRVLLASGLDTYLMEEEVMTNGGSKVPSKRARGKRTSKTFTTLGDWESEAKVMSKAEYEKSLRRKACTLMKSASAIKETPASCSKGNIVRNILDTRPKLMVKEWREVKKLCEASNITYISKEQGVRELLNRSAWGDDDELLEETWELQVTYRNEVRKSGIRIVLITNIESCGLHPAIAGIFKRKARVVRRRKRNVAEILCNYKQLIKKPELPLVCKHYDLPVVSGHVLTRIADVPRLPTLALNRKNVVRPKLETTKEEVSSSIRLALTTVLGSRIGKHLPNLLTGSCFSSKWNERCVMDDGLLYAVKRQFRDLLITQVDRNAGDLVLMCPSTYQHGLNKMFAWSVAYDEVSSSESETLKEMKRDSESRGLHRLVNWNSKGRIGNATGGGLKAMATNRSRSTELGRPSQPIDVDDDEEVREIDLSGSVLPAASSRRGHQPAGRRQTSNSEVEVVSSTAAAFARLQRPSTTVATIDLDSISSAPIDLTTPDNNGAVDDCVVLSEIPENMVRTPCLFFPIAPSLFPLYGKHAQMSAMF
ncbi:hypothetical protein CBR_g34678 [Chara braunii]|uniref:Uncharacterized protein n=1 Tax=Chara braunii TaxID=69332 RepID=A0A388JYX9_CHABU|nr:hypothetical protein CBR_g34678 [Chara braunii]|eukprot:GBG62977.1 hypothetical protein CBR_g34678 [Chara braunii]